MAHADTAWRPEEQEQEQEMGLDGSYKAVTSSPATCVPHSTFCENANAYYLSQRSCAAGHSECIIALCRPDSKGSTANPVFRVLCWVSGSKPI